MNNAFVASEERRKENVSTLSKISVENITKDLSVNATLTEKVTEELSLKVALEFVMILRLATKRMRQQCVYLLKEHVTYALRAHDKLLIWQLVDSDPLESDSDDENSLSEFKLERTIRREGPKRKATCLDTVPNSGAPKAKYSCGWVKSEEVVLKPNQLYLLSKEQQTFYALITEACVGCSESKRRDALQTLITDPSLQSLLPCLSLFIFDAVRVNVMQQNMAMLLYLMRMVRALLANNSLSLYKYLHLFIPSVLTCVLSSQSCAYPMRENHWALREYSGNIMAEILRHFNNVDTTILNRVVGIYRQALYKRPLTTVYGAVIGLGKMGNFVIRACVIPYIGFISSLIKPHLLDLNGHNSNSLDKQAAKYIRHRMLKICTPILTKLHKPPDGVKEYAERYGYLGPFLCDAIVVMRIKARAVADAKKAAEKAKEKDAENKSHAVPSILKAPTIPNRVVSTRPNGLCHHKPAPAQTPGPQTVLPKTLPKLQPLNGLTTQLPKQLVVPAADIVAAQSLLKQPVQQLRTVLLPVKSNIATRVPYACGALNKPNALGCNKGLKVAPRKYLVAVRKTE
ncbi:transcription initiation factor TFIID subunit 6 [Scaptodrosophila lebanonensis]|uniref:Transcription initiation factor TFIID subunit 6 n=1 Tax=Drosophila lebanonensis TaxID=7225 RepID=A0A6J2TMF9_DROLE|nr:transcription initiation factor TFIID subunit 6 [Scaptodrosophila lebanonensis]